MRLPQRPNAICNLVTVCSARARAAARRWLCGSVARLGFIIPPRRPRLPSCSGDSMHRQPRHQPASPSPEAVASIHSPGSEARAPHNRFGCDRIDRQAGTRELGFTVGILTNKDDPFAGGTRGTTSGLKGVCSNEPSYPSQGLGDDFAHGRLLFADKAVDVVNQLIAGGTDLSTPYPPWP
jgi:hypothetical protein